MERNKRIAFFTPDIVGDIGIALWRGVNEEAYLKNMDIVTINCGRFSSKSVDDINKFTLLNHFNKNDFDGVVLWGSSLFTFSSKDEVKSISEKYFFPLPCVSIQFVMDNCPAILYEDYDAMKSMMSHLVNAHKYQKIAFLRGPENHISAQNRFQAYKDAHSDYHMPEYDKLISSPGDWFNRGKDFIAELIDKKHLLPGKDFDAIMTSNAHMAKECIKELGIRGIKVPKDVAVAGFNDDREAQIINPPLTTANPPFHKMGQMAVDILSRLFTGEKISEKNIMPLDIIIRNSCGCTEHKTLEIFSKPEKETFDVSIDKRIQLVEKVIEDYSSFFSHGFDKVKKLLTLIINNLDVETDNKFYYFLNYYVSEILSVEENQEGLYRVINKFQSVTLPLLDDKQKLKFNVCIINLFAVINESITCNYYKRCSEANQINKDLNALEISLIENFSIESLIKILKRDLKKVKIDGISLFLYQNKDNLNEPCKMFINFNENRENILVDSDKILNDRFLEKESPYSLLATSLYFDKDIIGVLIFNSRKTNIKKLDLLRSQIASVLKGVLLLEEIEASKELLVKKSSEMEKVVKPMIESIKYITNTAEEKLDIMKNMDVITENGNKKITQTNAIIKKVSSNINSMSDMIKNIDDISISIKLLAINASVASSKAGDFGKIFGVIAKEVRKLSDSTKANAESISRLLNKIIDDIQESSKSSLETYTVFNEIKSSLSEVLNYLSDIGRSMLDLKDRNDGILKVLNVK